MVSVVRTSGIFFPPVVLHKLPLYLVSLFLRQYKYLSEFSDGKNLLQLSMDTHQTLEASALQNSVLGPGHDVAPANPASQTRETVDTPSQDADNRNISWNDNPHFCHPHSHSDFRGTPIRLECSPSLNTHRQYSKAHLPTIPISPAPWTPTHFISIYPNKALVLR